MKRKKAKKAKPQHFVDPLYQLFEHNLFHRSYDDIGSFTKDVAEEYLAYLDSTEAHVPFHVRANLVKDLENEAHEMLVKKMYGCSKTKDYINSGQVRSAKELLEEAQMEKKPASQKKAPANK